MLPASLIRELAGGNESIDSAGFLILYACKTSDRVIRKDDGGEPLYNTTQNYPAPAYMNPYPETYQAVRETPGVGCGPWGKYIPRKPIKRLSNCTTHHPSKKTPVEGQHCLAPLLLRSTLG